MYEVQQHDTELMNAKTFKVNYLRSCSHSIKKTKVSLDGSFTCFVVVSITWYKQEDNDTTNYRIQENLPGLDAMTLCFRYKPKDSSNELTRKYLITIADDSMFVLLSSCLNIWIHSAVSRTVL